MGRGDKKTAKGKRFQGSFGKSRPHKVAKKTAAAATEKKATAPKDRKSTRLNSSH